MALPEAVQRISDAAEQAAVEAGMKDGAPGAKDDAKPVDAGKPSVALAPDPTDKIDPEDYKARYSNYKKQTDETISGLRNTLASTQQTLAEVQRQNAELAEKFANVTAAPKVEDTPTDEVDLSGLPEDIREGYDENFLKAMAGLTNQNLVKQIASLKDEITNLKGDVSQVSSFQAKTAQELYYEAMDATFPDDAWINMTQGPEWTEFCRKQVSPVDTRTYGEIVKQGSEEFSATTVMWVLNTFIEHQAKNKPADDVQETVDPLEAQLTPEGDGGGSSDPIGEINAGVKEFTQAEITQFYTDVSMGKKYTPEQAAEIETQIKAALAAGKVR